jgi:hypothetical protein
MRKGIFTEIEKWNAQNRAKNARRATIITIIAVTSGILVNVGMFGISLAALMGSSLTTILSGAFYIGYTTGVIFYEDGNIQDELLVLIAENKNIDDPTKRSLGNYLIANDGMITFAQLSTLVNDINMRKGTAERMRLPGVSALVRCFKGKDS